MADDRHGTGIDSTVPHSARIWNYWLGGKDNYDVDRAAGDAWVDTHPDIRSIARGSRDYLARVLRHLVHEEGVRQFLDVGTGLPTTDNTHEIAQRAAPDARVVYVDNDPLVLAHARALLTSTPEGATAFIRADMHDTAAVLAEAATTLDLDRPVAVLFQQVLGHVVDDDAARTLIRGYLDGVPSGSYLSICDGFEHDDAFQTAGMRYAQTGALPYVPRTPEQVAEFFAGLEWVEPGFVRVTDWRPDAAAGASGAGAPVNTFGGLARKP